LAFYIFTIACGLESSSPMGRFDNSYSRIVATLKIVLPLAALAILSTMFLVSRNVEPSQIIPYADIDPNEITRDQRIGSPVFSSMTQGGSSVTLSARTAQPDGKNPKIMSADAPVAKIETKAGTVIDIAAATGQFDTTQNTALLSGDVLIKTSNGYTVETSSLKASFDDIMLTAENPISGTGPIGDLQAGSMILTQIPASGPSSQEQHLLVFKNGVKLIYQPTKR